MRKLRFQCWLLILAASIPATGCGSDPAPAEAASSEPQAFDAGTPFAEIPREQLYGASPTETLWSPQFELEVLDLPPGWDGARIAILSDLHLGVWAENQQIAAAAIRRAVQSGADVVVLLGDYAAAAEDVPALREVLTPLGGRPVFAVLGDRDIQSDSLAARITQTLVASGATVLRNTAAPVVLHGDTAWVAGLDPELLRMTFADQQYITATVGQPGRTPVLLTHVPALATRSPEGRFPVVIGGNTFCGQVEVPGTPRLGWLQSEVFPGGRIEGIDRLFRVQGGTVLVTCGIGFGYVPVRFGAPPEVPILTLRRVGAQAPQPASEAVDDTLIQRYQGEPADTM